MRKMLCFTFAAAITAAAASRGEAQTIQDRIDALEDTVEEQGKAIENFLGIDIHALVSPSFTYSLNNPDSDVIFPRIETRNHNTFDLYEASLYFSRMKQDEDFGIVVNLDFGTTAETVVSDWDGDGTFTSSSEETDSFELREAFGVYKTPLELPGGKISLKGGKFVTLLGYEIFYNYNAFNYHVSKSMLFGFAVPFTHTGLLAKFPFTDMVALDIGVVNGWDNVRDSNDSKSLLAGLGITPSDMVTMYFATTYGAEQPDSEAVRAIGIRPGHSKRFTLTGNVTVNPIDMLALVLDTVYANETDIVADTAGGDLDNALWYGAAFYVALTPIEKLTVALRAEVFDDSDGVRFAHPNAVSGSTTWEVTPSVAYQLTDYVLARLEYRHDDSSREIFNDGDGFNDTQDTFSGQLIFAF